MTYYTKVMIQSIRKEKLFFRTSLDVTFSPIQEASYEGYFLCRLESDETIVKIIPKQTLEMKRLRRSWEPLLLAQAEMRKPVIIKFKGLNDLEKLKLIEIQADY